MPKRKSENDKSMSLVLDDLTYWKFRELAVKMRLDNHAFATFMINNHYDNTGGTKHA